MKTVSFWARKGGVGKSSLALMVAGAAHARGLSVVLVDLDTQGSLSWLSQFDNFPCEVIKKVPANGYDLVIIDYPPNLDTTPIGTVCVPYAPAALDIGAVKRYIPKLRKKGLTVIEVVNKVNNNRSESREYANKQRKAGALLVKDRSIYQRAQSSGTTIFDKSLNGKYAVREARAEINTILEKILND